MSDKLTQLFFGALLVGGLFYLVGGFDQFQLKDFYSIYSAR